jgi:multidrug resistance efflux pump
LATVAIIVIAADIGLAISGRWNAFVGSRSEQTTDDAVLRADVTPLSTKNAGLVAEVRAEDLQSVKAGDRDQPELDRLRSGVSVVATIHTAPSR